MTIVLICCVSVAAEDWPTYQHDNRRSGVTPEALDLDALREQWVYQPPNPPQPAWHGPAKWDAYAGIVGLRSMRNYDPVFYVIAVNDAVYFGSSVDDAVHRLNASTGAEVWAYTTDGAVRMPPAYADGKLFFGSDDGHAYCIDADDAAPHWTYSPAPDSRLVPNDGKLVSLWPVRTGVLVDEGRAYFGAALMPWQKSYLCAVDAVSGEPDGPGLYSNTLDGVTMEGAILASPGKLYVPQGRSAPMVFNRSDGAHLGDLEGGGGVFAVLTPDAQIAHGPGNKTGWITLSGADTREKVASFEGGNAMVVTDTHACVLKDTELQAIDRASKEVLWTVPCDCPYSLILAGDMLLAGGANQVVAFRMSDGAKVWSVSVSGRAYGLAVANGRLFVSTDTGAIHCLK